MTGQLLCARDLSVACRLEVRIFGMTKGGQQQQRRTGPKNHYLSKSTIWHCVVRWRTSITTMMQMQVEEIYSKVYWPKTCTPDVLTVVSY